MDLLHEYGPALGGAFVTILTLSYVVRVLWRLTLDIYQQRVLELITQYRERLVDKDEQIARLREELKDSHDGARRILAENEWLQRMVERGNDLTAAALDEAKATRESRKG